ncbi:transposase [uncultured Nostoc sp.]|uniref:transposase n=1 Tax=uncultured Nostoc sp. TaxID=340711 RepID=UPI0026098C98|nr:transposase [uncultured Nostoc sp.]
MEFRLNRTNTEVFLTYVTQVLAPQLWKGAIMVMDNLRVHQAERVKIAIESVGAKVKFLPPYSPDLSPIELCWSKLKQFLRSREARTLELLDQAMADAVNYITEDDAYEKVQPLWSIYLKIAVRFLTTLNAVTHKIKAVVRTTSSVVNNASSVISNA